MWDYVPHVAMDNFFEKRHRSAWRRDRAVTARGELVGNASEISGRLGGAAGHG
ncbi:hypothetical protein ACVIGB_001394 [Bradyrhizobium sp. USDA 4341]